MSANTKIVVLRSKELVYALVLLVVSVLIIMVAVSLFMPADKAPENSAPATGTEESMPETMTDSPDKSASATDADTSDTAQAVPENSTAQAADTYVPGIYSSTLQLGSSTVELQISVDKNRINSINLVNIDESVETLYPLMQPTLAELSAVILSEQSLENVSYNNENRYTSMLLMQAINDTLDKAALPKGEDMPETATTY